MIKSDRWIVRMASERGLIDPFVPRQVRQIERGGRLESVISYGVSSYGYDIRLDRHFKLQSTDTQSQAVIDPKRIDPSLYRPVEGDEVQIPARGLAMAQSLETFRIPREVLVLCQGKSTYSRCGIQVSISPLEPEWEGRLTFAIMNSNACPAKVYAGEGIAQIMFFESDEVCETSYADRQGKYQNQAGLTPPRL